LHLQNGCTLMNAKTAACSTATNENHALIATSCDVSSLEELLSIALSLAPRGALTPAEKAATRGIKASHDSTRLDSILACIRHGEDPLGQAYCRIKNAAARRDAGQTFTPPDIVATMLAWARSQGRKITRIVDPGAGTGRYTRAALQAFPQARAVSVELDPVVAVLLRANLEACGLSARCQVVVDDYRNLQLATIEGSTLFIGNPPYVRHHQILSQWKKWYSAGLEAHGVSGTQLAGLHLHFFLKTCMLARANDLGCFITAAEWLHAGNGSALRELLTGPLGGIAVFLAEPELRLFDDALASGAITAFAPGAAAKHIRFSRFSSVPAARNLDGGRAVEISAAQGEDSWSALFQKSSQKRRFDQVELGEFIRVSRGQQTGKNSVWIKNPATPELPARFLIPTITGACDIIGAPNAVIDKRQALEHVISLPLDLKSLTRAERTQVDAFLRWACALGADKTYTAAHRSPWYHVRLDARPLMVMTYMRRGPAVFAHNKAGAPLLNIAHGLFPKVPLSARQREALVAWLNANVDAKDGCMSAGGLIKFEPSTAMKIKVPRKLLQSVR
jgi:adenine-specific DNA-methyltransferase